MSRASSLALLLLLLAGGAFAALGVRSWRLEEAEARRRAEDRATRALRLAADRAPVLAAAGHGPAAERWSLGLPLRRAAVSGDDALLLRQAAWQEGVAADPAAALATLDRLAAQAGDVAFVASLRAGTLRSRAGREAEAAPLLQRASRAPADVADEQDVPVRLAALYHLARAARAGTDEHLGAFLDAAEHGGRLAGLPGTGPDDLVLALERRAAERGAVPVPIAAAADRARRGRRLLGALPGPGVASAGDLVLRRTEDALEARPASSLLEGPDADDGVSLHVGPIAADGGAGPLSLRLDAPLDGLVLVAEVVAPAAARVPWNLVAGLAVYALGSILAVVALRRAVRTARLQGDFVAAVSHEMKTPIASVRAMAEMLADGGGADPDVARRYAERIGIEMERLGSSVRNVLDAARIERTGEVPLTRKPEDPSVVVAQAAEDARPGLERRGFRLTVEAAPAPTTLGLDAPALRTVLANLLDNAAKYGGERKEIEVTGAPTPDGGYRFAVRDRGIGVPASERERIFDRFFRGSAARAAALPGVGLGLHVARQIVRGHGGRIRAEAREGGGTSFVVDLPGRADA